jgi:pyruvate dehydrogenase E2 component (dihydrolipoamide acetyltransferase)
MATYLEMPKLADTMTEGTLVKWRKKIGDKVSVGDVVAEVETDKATMEIESFDDGMIHEFLVQPGEKVPIGSKIAVLLGKGEAPPSATDVASAKKPSAVAPAPAASPVAQNLSAAKAAGASGGTGGVANLPSASATAPSASGRVKSSPLARKLAAEKGVSIGSILGSGPGGRVVAKDVVAAASPSGGAVGSPGLGGLAAAPVGASIQIPVPAAGPGDQRIPLSGMRRVIADRLLASKTQIPHFYLHLEVDAAPMLRMRADLNASMERAKDGKEKAEGALKLTVNDFVLRAVAAAAVRVPAVNASFAGDSVVQFGAVHLSFAVAVEDGLVTPVIRDAQSKNLAGISEAVKDLATRARSKKLKPDEYQGGTLTVSNLGSYGVEFFDAIINPPQAVIVSVGVIVKKPVVGPGDAIVAGQRLAIGLSADHRVVDGAVAAQYLAEIKRLLESPSLLLI